MKANDGLRGSLFGQQIGRQSILGPPLCLCCGPNMICTCLLLCFLPCWAWPALSGGLCQHGDARRAVKSSIPAQNSSINNSSFYVMMKIHFFSLQKQVEGDKIICKVFQSEALIFDLIFPPPLFLRLQTLVYFEASPFFSSSEMHIIASLKVARFIIFCIKKFSFFIFTFPFVFPNLNIVEVTT